MIDVMARSYRLIHDRVENEEGKIIRLTLQEFKMGMDVGTHWLMQRYRRYTTRDTLDTGDYPEQWYIRGFSTNTTKINLYSS
jgi:hypothetical protein